MKISYNWLNSFFARRSFSEGGSNTKLPNPDKLADLLTMHSFEVESVKEFGNDWILDIDVLPNRAHDCLGHFGIAREIAALLSYKLQVTNYKQISNSKLQISNFLEIKVEDKKLCSRYTGRVMFGVKVNESPKWIQERLIVCGLKPINNIVDIANYVMLETGQPLHAFDFDKLESKDKNKKTIIVRRAKKGESIVTLDNNKFKLDEDILVIADEKNPVCIAGIKGGKNPEIDKSTKNIVLEAANFDGKAIRKGSKKLKLKTDASWRFEHEIDLNLTELAIDRVSYLIKKNAGGKILKGKADFYPNKVFDKKIKLDFGKVKSVLGVEISKKEIIDILERLNFKINGSNITIPAYRLDVSILEDLIEEIGRVYGFEKISAKLPRANLSPVKRNMDLFFTNKAQDILSGLGFSEAYNYSFVGDEQVKTKESLVEMANPISLDYRYLRPNLMLNLLSNIGHNKKYFNEIRLFEIGKIFLKKTGGVLEKKKIGAVIYSDNKNPDYNFYYLKSVVNTLLSKLGITGQKYIKSDLDGQALININKDCLGYLSELEHNPKIVGFELDFEKIVKLATEERSYKAPSKYPAVMRDLAVLVDKKTEAGRVMDVIYKNSRGLICNADLFDVYEGKNIPHNKKNFAFHFAYQSDKRNLTDKEVNQIQNEITKALDKKWEVRK